MIYVYVYVYVHVYVYIVYSDFWCYTSTLTFIAVYPLRLIFSILDSNKKQMFCLYSNECVHIVFTLE